MQQHEGMRINLACLLGWLAFAGAATWCAGAYLTLKLGGREALTAQSTAGICVLLVMGFNAVGLKYLAPRGPKKVAFGFLYLAAVRMALCIVMTIAVRLATSLPATALFIWMLVFYVCLLTAESIYLARALDYDAYLEALGEIRTPKIRLPSDLPSRGGTAREGLTC